MTRDQAIAKIDAALDGQLERPGNSLAQSCVTERVDPIEGAAVLSEAVAMQVKVRERLIALLDNPSWLDNGVDPFADLR